MAVGNFCLYITRIYKKLAVFHIESYTKKIERTEINKESISYVLALLVTLYKYVPLNILFMLMITQIKPNYIMSLARWCIDFIF